MEQTSKQGIARDMEVNILMVARGREGVKGRGVMGREGEGLSRNKKKKRENK